MHGSGEEQRKTIRPEFNPKIMDPIVERCRSRFILFWLRGDVAFAQPEVSECCEGKRVTYFIRLPANAVLNRLIEPYLPRLVGRPPKSGVQIRLVDLRYQAQTWGRERRVVAKIQWHAGELFPRIGFIVTNSQLPAGKVVKVYNGRGDVENRIKEGKNTLRWDKTSCRRFAPNQARLLMGVLAHNLLHRLRHFYYCLCSSLRCGAGGHSLEDLLVGSDEEDTKLTVR